MKRFHAHVAVHDLKQSIRFYSALFGMQPSVEKPDDAKWLRACAAMNRRAA